MLPGWSPNALQERGFAVIGAGRGGVPRPDTVAPATVRKSACCSTATIISCWVAEIARAAAVALQAVGVCEAAGRAAGTVKIVVLDSGRQSRSRAALANCWRAAALIDPGIAQSRSVRRLRHGRPAPRPAPKARTGFQASHLRVQNNGASTRVATSENRWPAVRPL